MQGLIKDQNSFRKRALHRGFTIVELLIVIVVIGILAALTLVVYNGIQNRAHEAVISNKESQAKRALDVYRVDHGSYPPNQSQFDLLTGQKPGDSPYTIYSSVAPHDSYSISTSGGTSVAISCPSGFVPVPGNSAYGTSDFCVMKYEAKNVGGVPVSQANGVPWSNVSQTTAISLAQSACDGCQLITEGQWMTIAANVMSVASNWSGGSVGSGYIYSGHNDDSPSAALAASTDDNDGYSGTGNTTGDQRRTLTLTNGQVVWDLAGNVWEFTQGTINGSQPGLSGESSYTYKDYTNTGIQWNNLPEISRPKGTLYARAQGVGVLYSNSGDNITSAFLRGGAWSHGKYAGIYALFLNTKPGDINSNRGMRATVQ